MKIDAYETSDVASDVFGENDEVLLEPGTIYADARENGKLFVVDNDDSCVTLVTGEVFYLLQNYEEGQQVYVVKNLTMSI